MRVSASTVASRAITMSTGIFTRPVARSRRHSSARSGCTSESPTPLPCASRNVNAIAPPMRTVSQRSSNALITPSFCPTFAPPITATNGRFAPSSRARQHLDFAEEQTSAGVRQQARRADDRRVISMGCTEGLVHVHISEFGQIGAKRRVALGLAGLEAQVLEHQDIAGRGGRHERLHTGAGDGGRQEDLEIEQLAETLGHRRHRVAGIGLPLRSAEMPARDDDRVTVAQPLDRGERGGDAEVVVDVPVGHGNVEVDAHERPRARERAEGLRGAGGRRT